MKVVRHTPEVCFVDPCAPRPYTTQASSLAGLGGTEMTLAALAGELSRRVGVEVRQSARRGRIHESHVRFAPFDVNDRIAAPVIVVINSYKVALKLARTHPEARIFLWLHVVPGKHCRKMGRLLHDAGVTVVCVSQAHADILRCYLHAPLPRLEVVYNMIPDMLRPDDTPRDLDRLFFASAPHKGLDQVYEAFAEMRRRIATLTLCVADPGYLRWDSGRVPEGVTVLGRLDRQRVWHHMRRSLCLFYPQRRFAETFGIVLAEANAVGCPVLVQQGLGANDEVVSTADQCIDSTDMDLLEARLRTWRETPPDITGRRDFRLSMVTERWLSLLEAAGRAEPVRQVAEA
ncbi:glycosyltransferase [Marinovum sp.]|uniref:glycosyltransferase n=1 Tax=Marinovum sp. TaxID=2024839 RepID=UPI002B271510|nr:glycosyltransferase [Marinovum sp.]